MYEINEIPSNSTVYLNDINKFIDEKSQNKGPKILTV